jgi:hypothetical protein
MGPFFLSKGNEMEIAEVIAAAEFDEYDADLGTDGLCATFALALKHVFPEVDLALVVLVDADGHVPVDRIDGMPYWRHVVGLHNGAIFDVDGSVELQHLIDNYCWNNRFGKGGKLYSISHEGLTELAKGDDKSFDLKWFEKWVEDLKNAKDRVLDRKATSLAM